MTSGERVKKVRDRDGLVEGIGAYTYATKSGDRRPENWALPEISPTLNVQRHPLCSSIIIFSVYEGGRAHGCGRNWWRASDNCALSVVYRRDRLVCGDLGYGSGGMYRGVRLFKV